MESARAQLDKNATLCSSYCKRCIASIQPVVVVAVAAVAVAVDVAVGVIVTVDIDADVGKCWNENVDAMANDLSILYPD